VKKEGALAQSQEYIHTGYHSEKYANILHQRLAIPYTLLGDPTRLQQALLNYAANALKFTERGHITLRVKEESQNEETFTLRFEVEDTGMGIAPEAVPKLFSAFEQADNSTTRKYGGTGLGLAITKKITELMGGTVGVKSIEGQGSTFWFTATLRKATLDAGELAKVKVEEAEKAIQRNHIGKRILVVEDEPINRDIAEILLECVGLSTDLAEDGQVAVRKASAGRLRPDPDGHADAEDGRPGCHTRNPQTAQWGQECPFSP
jgi:CheY-like chemotaxis protein